MGEIPWSKIAAAVRRRDARWLRALAHTIRSGEHRKLLLLFTDIVESGSNGMHEPGPNGNRNTVSLRAKGVVESSRDPLPAAARNASANSRERDGHARVA